MEDLGADDPRWIGEYRLLSRLGEGGMDRVYLARSARGRTVAVKLVRGELASKSDFRRRFQAEVRAAQRVGGDWTAPVLDADTEAATPWVATGYIGGPSLHQVVTEDHGPLPETSVRALARGLALALRDIHGAGLINRDLKPSNVLVTIDGPRVIDFGIARVLDSVGDTGLTMTGAVVGPPGFMSPEQVRGDPITAASDVFCLGSVLAFAATGRSPFGTVDSGVHALMYRVAQEAPDLAGLPEGLRELIDGCLTKDPASRFTLDQVLAHAGGVGPDSAGAPAARPGRWRRGGPVAAGRAAGPARPGRAAPAGGGDAADRGGLRAAGRRHAAGGQPPVGAQAVSTPPPSTPPGTQFGPPIPPDPRISGQPPLTTTHAAYAGQPTMGPHAGHPHTGVAAPLYPATGVGYRPPAVWRSPRVLANATVVLFSVGLLVMLMDLIFSLRLYGTYDDFFSDTVDSTALEDDEGVTEGFDALWFFLSIPMVVLWVIWFRRTYVNAQALAPGRQRFSSGLAAGAWFIPVVQFWFPKQMANDVWTASAPPTPAGYPPQPGTGRGLLNTWWVLFLAMLVTSTISFFVFAEAETYGEHQTSVAWSILTDVVSIPCAVFAIGVVVRLSALQERRVTGQPMPGQGVGPGGYGTPYGPGPR